MLIQLIYTSKAAVDLSDEQLGEILNFSIRNNRSRGITGLLLYGKGTFMQLLEGEADDVDATFRRIAEDTRHHDIECHLRTPASKREFEQWHMGYRAIRPEDAKALPGYAAFFENGFDARQLASESADGMEIMRAFAGLC